METFDPNATFTESANIKSRNDFDAMYKRSVEAPDEFWGEVAREFHWFEPFKTVRTWNPPHAKWFEGGKTNLSYNCLDRWLDTPRADGLALLWEGENGEEVRLTYRELLAEVCKFANVLKSLGVQTGDRVGIYMGMVPEAAIAMLACARLGAPHTVIFGGFSSDAIKSRLNDATAKVVVTQDGAFRRGKVVPLKAQVDAALDDVPSVEKVVVLKRSEAPVDMKSGRDVWWRDEMRDADPVCEAVPVDAEHPLFILYTSGTTGKPKGVLHTTAGYMIGTTLTSRYILDLKQDDVYWCTADVGWITGHSYIVYGPLCNGTQVLMYEGAPDFPSRDRFWDIIERRKVTVFYTAPTAVRAFMSFGDDHITKHDLSSLRLLGTVGEPINPEAWRWYHRVIGGGRCPIVDTWWQTETGGMMLAPIPSADPLKPGSCAKPFLGVVPKVLREDGTEADAGEHGLLVIEQPWPSMLRTVWGDDERFQRQYFSRFENLYFTGDGARRDEDGYFWVTGRVDDVLNVAGHRLGTAEIESALVLHPAVAEAAVVGRPDAIKGQAIVAFVTPMKGVEGTPELEAELREQVTKEIGKFARPDEVRVAPALPKTRSGKIVRRILGALAAGNEIGDTTTLENPAVIDALKR